MSGSTRSPGSRDAALDRLVAAARRLERDGLYVLLSHDAHFLSPLVRAERERLRACPALDDEAVLDVVERLLPEEVVARREQSQGAGSSPSEPPPLIFFPVPIARALAEGRPLDLVLHRFHYDLIHIDPEQQWTWRGAPVAPRTKEFFLEHTRWEPELGRWLFEYRVHDQWWDKSYYDAEITPFLATTLTEEAGELEATVQSGQRARVAPTSFRLDERERLFVTCDTLGEVLCSEPLRFRLLEGVSEDLQRIRIGNIEVPLRWPEQEGTEHGQSTDTPHTDPPR